MTFLEIVNLVKTKYKAKNQSVIFNILFHLSKEVKSIESFAINRNNEIDFNKNKFLSLLDEYFVKLKPLSYITKQIKFCNVNITVLNSVLEPRNETEWWTNEVISSFKSKDKKLKVLDLCCGTGCIGLAIKKAFKHSMVDLVDINNAAIKNTKLNAKNNHLNVNVIKSDYLKFILNNTKKYDLVVCNPPYVSNNKLDNKLLKYESKRNFVNSKKDLDFYINVINNINKILKKHSLLVFEIGYDQKQKLTSILKKHNLLAKSSFKKDLNKHWRNLYINN